MIIISLTDCPPGIRGDLSKWLCEVNTGVYVGNVSGRVRDALWERICEQLRNGRATMVYPAHNEQGFAFRVHNTTWEPVDFDGITFMRRPSAQMRQTSEQISSNGLSIVEKQLLARRRNAAYINGAVSDEYYVIDLETTGLSTSEDYIVEIGAIRVAAGVIHDCFSRLILIEQPMPPAIVNLTGITDDIVKRDGGLLEVVLPEFLKFIGTGPVVGYNVSFDIAFLRTACSNLHLEMPRIHTVDVLDLARRKVFGLPSLKMERLAEYFHLTTSVVHRALNDCQLTWQIYQKLTEPK